MHTISGKRMYVNFNGDWSGSATVSWETDDGGRIGHHYVEIPTNALLSGWIPASCEAPRWVLCQAIALTVREHARREVMRALDDL